jgi:hypothetical protein
MHEDDLENDVSPQSNSSNIIVLDSKLQECKKVRELVRKQLLAGAESAFAFVL